MSNTTADQGSTVVTPNAGANAPAPTTGPAPEQPGDGEQLGDREMRENGKLALKEILQPVTGRLMLGRILGALSAVLSIAPYIALVKLGDILLGAADAGHLPDADEVGKIAGLLAGSFLAQLGLLFIALAITHFADLKLNQLVTRRMVDKLSRAPLAWFTDTNSGRVRKAVQDDVRTLHQLVAHAPVDTTVAIVTPIALVAYAFVIDWRLGLLSVVTLPVYAGIQAWSMRGMGQKAAEMDSRLGTVSATAVEFADGITVVKAFGKVGQAHRRFRDAARDFADFYYAWVGPLLRISALSESAISAAVIIVLNIGIGSIFVRAGWVTPAEVLVTALIALVVPSTIVTIGNTAWSYQLAGNAALRIKGILDGPELAEPAERVDVESTRIVFEDVSFSYGRTRALQSVDLTLEPGTITALVGPSGSGKSTLATMVARFQDPSHGTVSIGGTDIRDLPTRQLYELVSFVLQNPQLPRISIRENIALANPDATDDEIWEAAEAAQIADDIRALPAGLDTVIGAGTDLSGGQRQRISIARALITDAPILILDEATAATDPDCEAEIQAALNHLVAGRTVLVIGHKPETVIGADAVVVLRDGAIARVLRGSDVTARAVRELMAPTGAHMEGTTGHA